MFLCLLCHEVRNKAAHINLKSWKKTAERQELKATAERQQLKGNPGPHQAITGPLKSHRKATSASEGATHDYTR